MPKFDWASLGLLIFIMSISVVFSCGEEKPVTLNREDKKMLDSIFFSKKDSMINLTDSLCQDRYAGLLSHAIDSIKQVRREEIESILSRR